MDVKEDRAKYIFLFCRIFFYVLYYLFFNIIHKMAVETQLLFVLIFLSAPRKRSSLYFFLKVVKVYFQKKKKKL